MADKPNSDIKKLNEYVRDARFVHAEWHNESWRDEEMFDGQQWSPQDLAKAQDAEIDPLTINMIFPVVNLVLGHYELNPQDILAKARTKEDGEIAQTMSEAIKFVSDQNEGSFKLQKAFRDQSVPGFGCMEVCVQPDPRYETVSWAERNWQDVLWDPFGSPWFEPHKCRYTIYQPWVDVEDLIALFPKKKREIEDKFAQLTGDSYTDAEVGDFHQIFDDAQGVEEYKRSLIGGGWADRTRRRVRPVEIWHTKFVNCLFVRFKTGLTLEVREDLPAQQQMEMLNQADEILRARVRKVIVSTLLGDLVLQDHWSPHNHDLYPQVPFVGYLDRYRLPYGVPRNLRDQNIEINKRRSMALALLGSKRVVATSDVGQDDEARQNIYEEAQKVNGFVLIEPSDTSKNLNARIAIQDQSALATGEINLMQLSKQEIQEISGANAEQLGYESNAESGVAIERRQRQGATILAPLFGHARRSRHMLGVRTAASIQQYWTGPKVLRVTDRLSGAEKFVEINRIAQDQFGNNVTLNRINQSKFDFIVSESPATDTVREKNMALLIETIKKSPPEAVPLLLSMAFEMSNLPNKEMLMLKLKPLLGIDPSDEDKSPEQIKQEAIAAMEAQKKQQAQLAELEQQKLTGEAQQEMMEVRKIAAEVKKILSEVAENNAEVTKIRSEVGQGIHKSQVEEGRLMLDGYKTGLDAGQKLNDSAAKEQQQNKKQEGKTQ